MPSTKVFKYFYSASLTHNKCTEDDFPSSVDRSCVSPTCFFAKQHNEAEADRERNPSMRAEPNVVFCVVIYFSKASIRMWWPVHVMIFPSDIVVCKWSTTNIACATQRYKTHWSQFKLSPIFQKIVL